MNESTKKNCTEKELSFEEMKDVAGGRRSIPNRETAYVLDSDSLKDSLEVGVKDRPRL